MATLFFAVAAEGNDAAITLETYGSKAKGVSFQAPPGWTVKYLGRSGATLVSADDLSRLEIDSFELEMSAKEFLDDFLTRVTETKTTTRGGWTCVVEDDDLWVFARCLRARGHRALSARLDTHRAQWRAMRGLHTLRRVARSLRGFKPERTELEDANVMLSIGAAFAISLEEDKRGGPLPRTGITECDDLVAERFFACVTTAPLDKPLLFGPEGSRAVLRGYLRRSLRALSALVASGEDAYAREWCVRWKTEVDASGLCPRAK